MARLPRGDRRPHRTKAPARATGNGHSSQIAQSSGTGPGAMATENHPRPTMRGPVIRAAMITGRHPVACDEARRYSSRGPALRARRSRRASRSAPASASATAGGPLSPAAVRRGRPAATYHQMYRPAPTAIAPSMPTGTSQLSVPPASMPCSLR